MHKCARLSFSSSLISIITVTVGSEKDKQFVSLTMDNDDPCVGCSVDRCDSGERAGVGTSHTLRTPSTHSPVNTQYCLLTHLGMGSNTYLYLKYSEVGILIFFLLIYNYY